MKLNAKQLRETDEKDLQDKLKGIRRRPIYLILENVYDTYNIGGLFRLADALAVERVYLCGSTETPPNHRILKASVGAYKAVPWTYKRSVKEAITDLNSKFNPANGGTKLQIVAIEQHEKSVDYRKIEYKLPLVLILGNETDGVSEETLQLAHHIVEIPMWGINKSLNVIVSAAIVAYRAADK